MKDFAAAACLTGVLSTSIPLSAIADGVDYEDCVNRRVNWCTSVYSTNGPKQLQCIIIGMGICHEIHGSGGGGGASPGADSFTAEQKSTYDQLLKDLDVIIREEERLRDAVDSFQRELRKTYHDYKRK